MRHSLISRLFRDVRLSPDLKALLVSSFCLLVLLSAAALAQSGRKQKKPEPQPPVQGINQPEARTQPEPVVPPEKPKEPGPSLLIATSMSDISIPSFYVDVAREGCLRELRQVRTLELRDARNQTRSDAIKAAKENDRTPVVFMELELDRLGNNGFDLRYTIFEPKTAKVIGTGSGYPVQPTDRLPVPPIGASRSEVMVEWAGRDVGRQVLKKLRLRE